MIFSSSTKYELRTGWAVKFLREAAGHGDEDVEKLLEADSDPVLSVASDDSYKLEVEKEEGIFRENETYQFEGESLPETYGLDKLAEVGEKV